MSDEAEKARRMAEEARYKGEQDGRMLLLERRLGQLEQLSILPLLTHIGGRLDSLDERCSVILGSIERLISGLEAVADYRAAEESSEGEAPDPAQTEEFEEPERAPEHAERAVTTGAPQKGRKR